MKISTKGIYALEIIADMAIHTKEAIPESLKNIAKRRNLSEKYLERIIGMLRQAGLVTSIRGAYGGYCLAKHPEDISVKDVLNAVEGELAPVACLTEESECGIECDCCPTRKTWGGIWEQILKVTDEVSIGDILNYIEQ